MMTKQTRSKKQLTTLIVCAVLFAILLPVYFIFVQPLLDEVLSEVGEVLDAMEDSEEALAALDADLAEEDEWETVILPEGTEGEVLVLEDGRIFRAAFLHEIRSLDAPDLRIILDEQKDLYTPEEYAYIEEVMAERLGDIH